MKRKYRILINSFLWIIGLISIILGILAFPSIYTMIFPPPLEEKLILSPTEKNITTSEFDIEFPFTVSNNYGYPIYDLQIEITTNNKSRTIHPLEIIQTPESKFPKKIGDVVTDTNYIMIDGYNSDGHTNRIFIIRYVEPQSTLVFNTKPNKISGEKPYTIYFKNLCFQKNQTLYAAYKDNGSYLPFTPCVNETVTSLGTYVRDAGVNQTGRMAIYS